MIRSDSAFELSKDMEIYAVAQGKKFNVCGKLSDKDQLLGYFINKAMMEPIAATDSYFDGGSSDASVLIQRLEQIAGAAGGKKILEFASGFGRVTRHLHVYLPADAELTASDIHIDACDFIRDEIGAQAVVSSTDPTELNIPGSFDFIFAFSFFSHLPDKSFGSWIASLYKLLAPGGHLLITTHGQHAIDKHPDFFGVIFDEKAGFGFRGESDQADIASEDYGSAVVSDAYVTRAVESFAPGAEIVSKKPNVWFGLQDEWVIRRP